MKKELLFPKLADDMEKGVLCAWLKEVGETVEVGEVLYEIETNKMVTQVESTEAGVLSEQLAEEGDEVAVLAPVAIVER